jgi:hypothetical protein
LADEWKFPGNFSLTIEILMDYYVCTLEKYNIFKEIVTGGWSANPPAQINVCSAGQNRSQEA